MWGSNVSLYMLVLLKCLSNLFAYLLLLRPFGHRIKKITKMHFCKVSAQTLTIERAHAFSCVPQIIVVPPPQSKFSQSSGSSILHACFPFLRRFQSFFIVPAKIKCKANRQTVRHRIPCFMSGFNQFSLQDYSTVRIKPKTAYTYTMKCSFSAVQFYIFIFNLIYSQLRGHQYFTSQLITLKQNL